MTAAKQLRKIKNFLRNIFAHEILDEAPVPVAPAEPRRQFAAILFRHEPLALDEPRPAPGRAGVFGRLLAPDVLSEEPVEPPREASRGLLRALFGRETLPEDPLEPPAPVRPGLLRALFAAEPLPELSAPPAKPARSAWLRWLFRFERLDPP